MADSDSRPVMAWDDLETFVTAIEQLSYSDVSRSAYFSQLNGGLGKLLPPARIQGWRFHSEGIQNLIGSAPPGDENGPVPDPASMAPGESRCESLPAADGGLHLVVDHRFQNEEILRLDVQAGRERGLTAQTLREVLGTCAVLAGNFLTRSLGRDLQTRLADQQQSEILISQLAKAELAPQNHCEVCRVVQAALQVDRVSLLWANRRGARLLGTSASTAMARNTRAVRLLEQITATACRQGQWLDVNVGAGRQDPVLSRYGSLVDDYIEETSVRSLKLIPVLPEGDLNETPTGYLLLEHFSGDWPDTQQQRLFDLVEPHILDSFRRVSKTTQASGVSRLGIWWSDWAVWSGGMATLAAIAVILLLTVPKELEIPVDGVLMPVQRAAIFAPRQGIVDGIEVHHGDHVDAGGALMSLRSPDLEIEERRLSGEMATIRSRLNSLKAARIRNRTTGSRQETETDLSAEESDLEAQLTGLTNQLALVLAQMEMLVVKSPLSGQVDRWDLNQALADRPVAHGQHLCDVLDVNGRWAVELRIPDDEVGYVLKAQAGKPCPVTYLFRTDSDRKYESQIETISNSVQIDREGQPVVLASMPAAADGDQHFRVGASVIARIHCGRHSVGFVWLREVIEFVRRTLWF